MLEEYGKELEKSISPKDVVPGVNVYAMFGAVRSDLMGSGLTMLFWFDIGHYLHSQGFRFMYGRSSNIKSFHLLTTYGGDALSKIKVVENGKVLTLSFFRFPMDPLQYIRHNVNKFMQKSKL